MIANKVFNAGTVKEGDVINFEFKGNASPSITEVYAKPGCGCTSLNNLEKSLKDKEGFYPIQVDGDFKIFGTINTKGNKVGKRKKMITIGKEKEEQFKLFIEYEIR